MSFLTFFDIFGQIVDFIMEIVLKWPLGGLLEASWGPLGAERDTTAGKALAGSRESAGPQKTSGPIYIKNKLPINRGATPY